MELPRKQYLEKLIRKKDNGRIKVITGIRFRETDSKERQRPD